MNNKTDELAGEMTRLGNGCMGCGCLLMVFWAMVCLVVVLL
jgi:hypothetical protein